MKYGAKAIINRNGEDCGLFQDGEKVTILRWALGDVSKKHCLECEGLHGKWKVLPECLIETK